MRAVRKYPYIILSLIMVFGFALRVYGLDSTPAGFFCDEAATGYNAWTILTSGRDEYGRAFPAYFQSFGIWRGGIPFYAAVPSVAAFGLTEFASRLPSAVIGTATIGIMYLFTSLMFPAAVAIAAAFFLAVSPWHIHFSRFAEANIYLPFMILTGMYLFLRAVKSKNGRALIASSVVFGLTVYTYFPAYAIVPAVILTLIVIYRRKLIPLGISAPVSLLVLFVVLIPFLAALFKGTVFARLSMVSRGTAGRPAPEVFSGVFSTYIDHFLPEFLFLEGDIGYRTHFITRYSVRGMGQLYLYQLPLIITGIFFLIRHFNKDYLTIFLLLLLYPLGSSAAPFADGGGPFATRSIIGVIPFQIISAAGLMYLLEKTGGYLIRMALVVFLSAAAVYSAAWYMNAYFAAYNSYSLDFWGWQYGARGIMHYYLTQKDRYDELYLVPAFNGPDIFPKFYDPANVCRGKCKIGDISAYDPGKRQLFSVPAEEIDNVSDFTIIRTVPYPDGKPAFFVGERTGK